MNLCNELIAWLPPGYQEGLADWALPPPAFQLQRPKGYLVMVQWTVVSSAPFKKIVIYFIFKTLWALLKNWDTEHGIHIDPDLVSPAPNILDPWDATLNEPTALFSDTQKFTQAVFCFLRTPPSTPWQFLAMSPRPCIVSLSQSLLIWADCDIF